MAAVYGCHPNLTIMDLSFLLVPGTVEDAETSAAAGTASRRTPPGPRVQVRVTASDI
jgi:hypothetical protein